MPRFVIQFVFLVLLSTGVRAVELVLPVLVEAISTRSQAFFNEFPYPQKVNFLKYAGAI